MASFDCDSSYPVCPALFDIARKDAGYSAIAGRDGADALSKLTGQRVNLIISDVNMSNMDGVSFVTAVRQLPEYMTIYRAAALQEALRGPMTESATDSAQIGIELSAAGVLAYSAG